MTTFVPFSDELRTRLGAGLGEHDRRRVPLEGRKHAAVAIVITDSDPDAHGQDPLFADGADHDWSMSDVPATRLASMSAWTKPSA